DLESLDRLALASARREHDTEAVLPFCEIRPTAGHQLKLLECALTTAHHGQGRSNLSLGGGARTANLVCHRALQHRIELHHERIGWTDLPRAAQLEVGLSPFKIARV